MILRNFKRTEKRNGVTVVECALVYPVFFLFLIGLIVAALGVFRYQQMASLAREGARYAVVHGDKYFRTTFKAAATPEEVYEKAILPNVVGLDVSRLDYKVTWDPDNTQGSLVTVTVSYQWIPEAFLGGMTLSSTSTMEIAY